MKANKEYILEMLKASKRLDGRALDEMRPVKIEIGISENAEGSARVTIGDTVVLAGVKMATAEPYPDSPDKGVMTTSAEFMPCASHKFEGGRPGEVEVELARVVDRGIRGSECLDFEKLCITPGEKVWLSFLDILVLDHDGNLIDAAGIAAAAAFLDAKFPALDSEGKVDRSVPLTDKKIPMTGIPLAITVRKVNGVLMLDTTEAEEDAVDARITITTKDNGNITSIQMGGIGGFTDAEIAEAAKITEKTAKKLRDEAFKKAF